MNKLLLEDKVAVITGGGQGIGRSIALKLAREGARVVIGDINIETAGRVAEEIRSAGGDAQAVKADVSLTSDAEELMKFAVTHCGKLDILVNNAGVPGRGRPISETTDEEWNLMMNVNLKGQFNCIRAVDKYMKQRNYGKVINLSALGGIVGSANSAAYAVSKWGVVGLTKCAARELGEFGIYVNAMAPGNTETPATAGQSKEMLDRIVQNTVLHRRGKPEDIAALALFLASDESNFITGQVISIDGGRMDKF